MAPMRWLAGDPITTDCTTNPMTDPTATPVVPTDATADPTAKKLMTNPSGSEDARGLNFMKVQVALKLS